MKENIYYLSNTMPQLRIFSYKCSYFIYYIIYSFSKSNIIFLLNIVKFLKVALNLFVNSVSYKQKRCGIFKRKVYIYINIHSILIRIHTQVTQCLYNHLLQQQIISGILWYRVIAIITFFNLICSCSPNCFLIACPLNLNWSMWDHFFFLQSWSLKKFYFFSIHLRQNVWTIKLPILLIR